MDSSFVAFVDERDLRERILGVLNDLCVTLERLLPHAELQHIGSTSIPGAITKGDLDICVLVERSGFENADRVLAQHFARNVGSDQTESRSSFVDDSRAVPVGVQLVVRGGARRLFRSMEGPPPRIAGDLDGIQRAEARVGRPIARKLSDGQIDFH